MNMYDRKDRTPNFDLNPFYEMKDIKSYAGEGLVAEIKKAVEARKAEKTVLVLDYYYGVDEKVIYDTIISKLGASLLVDTTAEVKYPEEKIYEMFGKFITDDRENGVFCTCHIDDFFDPVKVEEVTKKIDAAKGLVVVYGVGAQVVAKPDLLAYCTLSFKERDNRYDAGMPNWGANNGEQEGLKRAKRDTFLEARVQMWHAVHIIKDVDFAIDNTVKENCVMISGEDWRTMMERYSKMPFKMIPSFKPGVWGGNWSKVVLGAGKDLKNTAWGQIGVVDYQPVKTICSDHEFIMPIKFVELYKPLNLLGPQVFFLFGYRNPTTMTFLDTFGGGNLSLQVHPTNAYAQEEFNSQFGHYESYYMLDTCENSSVYLGLKNGVEVEDFVNALREAQKTGKFDDTKYVNRIPMKTHDHIFIPSGTVHCSGVDTMVLELNTVGCSTFKLWDWGRLGLDGKPRPINVERGAHVIQKFDTDFTLDRLVSKKQLIERGYGWRKEHSGLMEYEPEIIDRYWVTKAVTIETKNRIHSICLVSGEEAIITSPLDEFKPIVIHYAEGVIVPAAAGQFMVRPYGKSEGQEIAFVECYQNLGSEN